MTEPASDLATGPASTRGRSADLSVDVAAIAGITAVSKILDVVCRATGMGFAAVARVTEDRWVACAVQDALGFGLVPGGELDVRTTICDEIRCSGELVVFDHASENDAFRAHPTPKMYGFESYISVPINRSDGSLFGTLCALDPRPASVERPEIVGMFVLFADLIAAQLDGADRILELASERSLLQANEVRLQEQQAVTERQLAELHDREERLRLALDGGNLGMWDVDARTGEVIWNQQHASMQGYGPAGPRSPQHWQQLVHPDDRAKLSAAVESARSNRTLFAEEHRLHRADTQELRWMSLHGRFFYDELGEPVRFTGVSVDITDRKLAEEALRAEEQHERRTALTLQNALLPSSLRRHPSIDMEVRYRAADAQANVGGDWYDTFAWPDGCLGLVVGDVVGHSIESAATMGRLRAAAAALATQLPPDPALFLEALDSFARGPDGTDFATAMCVIVDPERATLSYSLAGHPPPILFSADGPHQLLERALAVPLCVGPVARRPKTTVALERGMLLVGYTDGLVERRGESIVAGIDRLVDRVGRLLDRPVAEIADDLVAGATADGDLADDDVVIACFRYLPR